MRRAVHPAACRAACATFVTLALAACGGDDSPATPETLATAQQACSQLAGKTIAGASVTAATTVAATATTPTFCKVNATIPPQLHLELRLPDQWNSKLYYEGGGGYNGSIQPLAGGNLAALKFGYATVTSDSGHTDGGLSAAFALNDALATNLFGSLSVPTVMSSTKEMLVAAYGKQPERSYLEGCSEGGREGMMAAQRNPNLFDGIVVRAPAHNWVGFMGHFNRNQKAVASPGGQLNDNKIKLLSKAVRDACDAKDGIVDGIVSNPQACTFDATSLRCAAGADAGDTCLSDAQLAVITSRTSAASYVGGTYKSAGIPLNGTEDDPAAGWNFWVTGNGNVRNSAHYLFQDTTVKNYLVRDLARDSLAYEWESNLNALYSMAVLNDATDPDLRAFKNSNAKLIFWHGGDDPSLSARDSLDYYQAAVAATGGQAAADDFMRYYVAPGVLHCRGGPGADQSDLLSALDAWVTKGTAPGTLTATRLVNGAVQGTRPLCRYPQYPRYTGPANDAGAAAQAANYTCTSP